MIMSSAGETGVKRTPSGPAGKTERGKIVMAAKPFQISAKDLGGLAVEGACERCFWIRRHRKLPYQMFPGVFTILADKIKEAAHVYTDAHDGHAPPWLERYGTEGRYCTQKMSWQSFKYHFEQIPATLTGMPDDIWEPKANAP